MTAISKIKGQGARYHENLDQMAAHYAARGAVETMSKNIEEKSSSSRAKASGWARRPSVCSVRRTQALCWVRGSSIQSLADELTDSFGKALAIPTDITHYDQFRPTRQEF